MRILEVGPRDGLQNEKKTLSLGQREELVKDLLKAGITDIEVGSFVRREAIPQLAHTASLVKQLLPYKKSKFPQAKFWAFVPNERGLDEALRSKIDAVALYAAASESFLKRNINRSFSENKLALKKLYQTLSIEKKPTRVYLSTLVHCPFEGSISTKKLLGWIDFLLDVGFKEIVLSDTTGHAYPKNIEPIFDWIHQHDDVANFALHFHDTRGTALVNTLFSVEYGFNKFDSSLGGAGGCPYAPGASGNLATEDLVYFLQSLKQVKKISLPELTVLSTKLEKWLGKTLPSKVLQSFKAPREQPL